MIPQDYHVHSHHSVDCKASIEEMVLGAIRAGIPEIGFAEHFDLHPLDPACDWFKLDSWAEELEACRQTMVGRLRIRAGVEVGEPHIYAEELRQLLGRYPFDYVIGSLHWIGDELLFEPEYFRRSASEAFGLYFKELDLMAASCEMDILGHLDVPARLSAKYYGKYDPHDYRDMILPVLRKCIERGVALDINTAAVRRGIHTLTPGLEILTWYRELGGERVTLGSDAHRPEHLGADLDLALEAVRRAGLRYLTFFEKREPRLVPLPC